MLHGIEVPSMVEHTNTLAIADWWGDESDGFATRIATEQAWCLDFKTLKEEAVANARPTGTRPRPFTKRPRASRPPVTATTGPSTTSTSGTRMRRRPRAMTLIAAGAIQAAVEGDQGHAEGEGQARQVGLECRTHE